MLSIRVTFFGGPLNKSYDGLGYIYMYIYISIYIYIYIVVPFLWGEASSLHRAIGMIGL